MAKAKLNKIVLYGMYGFIFSMPAGAFAASYLVQYLSKVS